MAILFGLVIYIAAVGCLCALVGATRAKRRRCIRATRTRADRPASAEIEGALADRIVAAGVMRPATRV